MHTCKELLEVADKKEEGISIGWDWVKNQWWLKVWKEDYRSELYKRPLSIEINYCPFCGEKLKKSNKAPETVRLTGGGKEYDTDI